MIRREEAIAIAHKHLKETESRMGIPLVLIEDATIEGDFGWVFVWESKLALETGNPSEVLYGNSPFIVDLEDGSVHGTGTAEPIDHYIEEYRRSRGLGQ